MKASEILWKTQQIAPPTDIQKCASLFGMKVVVRDMELPGGLEENKIIVRKSDAYVSQRFTAMYLLAQYLKEGVSDYKTELNYEYVDFAIELLIPNYYIEPLIFTSYFKDKVHLLADVFQVSNHALNYKFKKMFGSL